MAGDNMVAITQDTFELELTKAGILVVDWWAPWCGPCRMFAPIFERAAKAHPEARFGKINTEEQPELSAAMDIRSIPSVMIFRDGILLFEHAGLIPEAVLGQLVDKVAALDMDAIRARLDEKERLAA